MEIQGYTNIPAFPGFFVVITTHQVSDHQDGDRPVSPDSRFVWKGIGKTLKRYEGMTPINNPEAKNKTKILRLPLVGAILSMAVRNDWREDEGKSPSSDIVEIYQKLLVCKISLY